MGVLCSYNFGYLFRNIAKTKKKKHLSSQIREKEKGMNVMAYNIIYIDSFRTNVFRFFYAL